MIYMYIAQFLLLFSVIDAEECGPMGFDPVNLLSPSYWYFDLPYYQCPPIPADSFAEKITNITFKPCRIYFNVCKKLTYQCSGTICARYLTTDLVSLLGEYELHPFTTPLKDNDFYADYIGERLTCKNPELHVKTRMYFFCQTNETWPIAISNSHGGAKSPQPIVSFDDETCQLTIKFNYSGACWVPDKDDSPVKSISIGTYTLILFFPGVILYFLMGALFNRARGKEGKEVIPHRQILEDLPELILDGFMFTYDTITCRRQQEEIFTGGGYEEVLGS